MTAQAVTPRLARLNEIKHLIQFETVAALTTGNAKGRRFIPFFGTISEVICNSGTAGSGGTSDIIDVNINGTTIFTTQGNRPTLLTGDTGTFTLSGLGVSIAPPEVVSLKPGDIVTYDIDQVASTGSALFTLTIIISGSR